jgi:hypothetical protein
MYSRVTHEIRGSATFVQPDRKMAYEFSGKSSHGIGSMKSSSLSTWHGLNFMFCASVPVSFHHDESTRIPRHRKEPRKSGLYSDWLQAGRPKSRSCSPCSINNSHFSTSSRSTVEPTRLPIQWVPVVPFPEVKQSGPDADYSPPTSAEVKKTWLYTSTPLHIFMAVLN